MNLNFNNKIPPVENFVFTDQIMKILSYAVNQNIEYETYTERQIANLEQSVKDDKFQKL